MKIKNPFKTKKILIIIPNRTLEITLPFFKKATIRIIEDSAKEIKGEQYDAVVVDEYVRKKK